MNAPALFILLVLTLLLIKGTQESAIVNAIIVFFKVAIVLVFIAIGWQYINPENHTPYIIPADTPAAVQADGTSYSYTDFWRHGWGGILTGAGIVFFAFIGFDAVSTAAQEAKNPKRDMPDRNSWVSRNLYDIIHLVLTRSYWCRTIQGFRERR